MSCYGLQVTLRQNLLFEIKKVNEILMMQKKTIACDNNSIADRLRGFTVSAELGPGHVDDISPHSCQSRSCTTFLLKVRSLLTSPAGTQPGPEALCWGRTNRLPPG